MNKALLLLLLALAACSPDEPDVQTVVSVPVEHQPTDAWGE